jgi:hypothetical protein
LTRRTMKSRRSVKFPRRSALVALLLFVSVAAGMGTRAHAGSIAGRAFSADHPDSVAQGASVTLIFHAGTADTEMKELRTTSDAGGHFHFLDLASDTSIAYVLQINYRGRDFLSNPIRFTPGSDEIDYSVLLADEPPDAEGGHGMMPPTGVPPRQNPFHMVLIVLWVVLLFAVFGVLARREDSRRRTAGLPPMAQALAREIAGLDLRHADGTIGDEEYRKVRGSLLARLEKVSGLSGGTGRG